MTAPAPSWQTPIEPVGPAPGVQFAGHGARLGAYILDALLVGFVTTLLLLVSVIPLFISFARLAPKYPDGTNDPAVLAELGPGLGIFIAAAIAISLLAMLYFPFFWARGGATPGMKAAGIRVVRDRDGSRIGWGTAILRLIGWWISGAVFYLGFIWILIDSRRRGWHDLIAGTCVIRSR